jgi:DNA mismatch repair protein MutS
MRPVREELTPMLSQYLDLCEAHPDALLLFQVGDFYEAFCEAAEETARVCEVTLTQRSDSTGEYPMAGIPIDNAASYVERLLAAGYRVALADQVEDAAEASGLVDRAVTRVVTPGTLTEDELLAVGSNYVACVTADAPPDAGERDPDADRTTGRAVAAVDVSTGECRVTGGDAARVREELERLAPAELLVGPHASVDVASLSVDPLVTDAAAATFERAAAAERLGSYVPAPEAVVESDAELRAVGALLSYAEYTQGDDGPLEYVSRVTRYDPRAFVRLDAAAVRSLELFDSRGTREGTTLVDVLDRTASALGRRRLEAWLRRPLVERERIEARHAAVDDLRERALDRERLRDALSKVYDLERLVSRVARGRANARDLRSLHDTLAQVPRAREALSAAGAPLLVDLREALVDLSDVRSLIDDAVAPDPPQEVTEGGVVREGFDADLDALRATEREGREWVAELEARERERTGIDSLSVGHTQVHGYYIEVTDPNLDRVPDDYTRRQTLKNAERFYTPELKRREDEIVGAAERADALEYELFREVRADVAAEAERLQDVADALADLDALASFAAVAADAGYCRPAMRDERGIEVEAGRHPVVERTTEFVPNDATLPAGGLALVTGPNMSGKSTYMRQVALTCVMAQAGSFVPADAARLPVLDRVFTRVGASDDIAGGQSTFMREMAELTDVLHAATPNSLVLLDEVGRGTSTTDGRAIARAAAEFVHDEVRAHTLFATHYHELTDLAADRERVFNLHFTVDRADADRDADGDGDDPSVRFLHTVVEGAADSSYGVEVARMAGVPDAVVRRARALVDDADAAATPTLDDFRDADGVPPATNGHAAGDGSRDGPTGAPAGDDPVEPSEPSEPTRSGDAAAPSPPVGDPPDDAGAAVLRALREADLSRTTPLEALNRLAELQERLASGSGSGSGTESGSGGGR